MKRAKHLSGWSRATWCWMRITLALMWASGVLLWLWPVEAVLSLDALQQGARHSAVVLHGVLTWLLCVLCGRGVWPHLRVIWQRRDDWTHWMWGWLSFVVLCLMAGAGLLLLYGPADTHDVLADIHAWLGIFWPALLLGHVWRRYLPRGLTKE